MNILTVLALDQALIIHSRRQCLTQAYDTSDSTIRAVGRDVGRVVESVAVPQFTLTPIAISVRHHRRQVTATKIRVTGCSYCTCKYV